MSWSVILARVFISHEEFKAELWADVDARDVRLENMGLSQQ